MAYSKYNQYLIRKMEIQQSVPTKIFFKFVNSVSSLINHQTFALFQMKYYIKEFKIEEIDETMVKNIYSGIVARSKKSFVSKSELNWLQNELRMFVWTLLYYSLSKSIEIQNFAQGQWDLFQMLFPNKRRILFQYQAYNLLKNHNQYKKWAQMEDQLFEKLVKKDGYSLRWSDLGKSLFIESDCRFFRTPKQCRERWLNHLDPSKMKKCWTEDQDFLLIQYVKYFGKKWANISKKLENRRNEHSIKNRFKSLITKQAKLFVNSTTQKEIVNSLYHKFLQNKQKNQIKPQESIEINQIDNQNSRHQEHFTFEDERPEVSIFDYCDQSQSYLKQKPLKNQILPSICLNNFDKQTQYRQSVNQHLIEKPAFQFSKIQFSEFKHDDNSKKSSLQQSEIQKRVRADLFLQQDPFQMLKCYFYKNSSSSQ